MDGRQIPRMGFGTFGRTGEAGMAAIRFALETGYRHLDTAQSYGTELECGQAVRAAGLGREQVFLTTKIEGRNCTSERLVASLEESCRTMGVAAVDLTLIHWSVGPSGRFDMADYLPALARAQERGLTRLIGVSNFTIADLKEAQAILGKGAIATNQVERHPFLQNRDLVSYCRDNGIEVTCYLPLARGRCAGDPVIEQIAARHNATAHQIALAFSLAQGHIVIPTSGRHERIAENYGALSVALSEDEIAAIAARDRGERQINPVFSPQWD